MVTSDVRPQSESLDCPLTYMSSVHLERLGSLSEETVRFYVAEIGSALSFLHDKRIIHRFVGVGERPYCS